MTNQRMLYKVYKVTPWSVWQNTMDILVKYELKKKKNDSGGIFDNKMNGSHRIYTEADAPAV